MAEYAQKTGASYIDSLTGLFNCGFFQICMDREIMRCQRHGTEFSLALVDVDSFGNFNRQRGFLAGDCLLKEIATAITQNLRQVDLAARYSGDIFALMMIETEPARALSIVHRICEAVISHTKGEATVSAGLAACPRDAVNSLTLLNKAYKALEQAKLRGKNKIYMFEGEIEPKQQDLPTVLIVDDDPRKIKLIEAMLIPHRFQVYKAENGEVALSIVGRTDFDLILLDIMMPVMNGYEVCRQLKSNKSTRMIPVVMVTALDDVKSKVLGIEAGADDFITMPPNQTELIARTKSLIHLKRLNNSLADIENILFSLANTVEAKDGYTQGHVERVSNLAVTLGGRIGLAPNRLEALRLGGALHDIGKIAVPDNILKKPGSLEAEELQIVRTHAERGWEICLPLKKNLGEALDIIRYHHEKLDGTGYPHGLQGEEIPITAQIMAVVDIYDSLITDRPYRKALAMQKAFEILRNMAADKKINPMLVEEMITLATSEKNIIYPRAFELPEVWYPGK